MTRTNEAAPGGIESIRSCILKKPPRRTLTVPGLDSIRAERRVEKALSRLEGVWAEANHLDGSVSVLLRRPHSEEELVTALNEAGFPGASFPEELFQLEHL